MKILVTGGAGFIGSHLVREFLETSDVQILDTDPGTDPPEQAVVIEADLRDETAVLEAVADADVVFHEGALVSVAESVSNPKRSHATNATGSLNVLEAARRHDSRVVFASSAAIYGQPAYTPIDEVHAKRPNSPYGLDKLASDQYMRLFHQLYDVETISLRYFNVYGPGQTGGEYAGVISAFVRQALDGEPITVHGEGEQTRDFVFVTDVVQANRLAVETDHAGTSYNVGTGESITIRKLAELIQDITDTSSDIVHVPPRDGDVQHSQADISRANNELGYEPTVSLREGIERTVKWFRLEDTDRLAGHLD